MSVKVISFDLDDTLWDNATVIEKAEQMLEDALDQTCPRINKRWSKQEKEKLKQTLYTRYGLDQGVSFLRLQWLRALLQSCAYPEHLAEELLNLFIRFRSQVSLYPKVEDSLALLKRKLKVIAITNGNADLKQIGIDHYFHAVIDPAVAGSAKPNPDIYLKASQVMACAAKEILHVGDHWLNDIESANQIGLNAAWFNPQKQKVSDNSKIAFAFEDWQQFFNILKQAFL